MYASISPGTERRLLRQIRAYVRDRQAEGAANASINRDMSALRRMFNLAIQAGRLSHRPYMRCYARTMLGLAFLRLMSF
ncbi:MAG: site-specific integrase [Alphaproteobacteria bacterium]